MRKKTCILLAVFSLIASAWTDEYTTYRLTYEPVGTQKLVHSGVFAKLCSGIASPTNDSDSIAFEVIELALNKDIDKLQRLSCGTRSDCVNFIDHGAKVFPEFFTSEWDIKGKYYIGSVVYYRYENKDSRGFYWRFKRDPGGAVKWNPGQISNYLQFRVVDSIRPEGDELTMPSKYATKDLDEFKFSDDGAQYDLLLYAKIHVATSTNELSKINDLMKYNQIFNSTSNENKEVDFLKDLGGFLGFDGNYIAILDADPLYIFWLPQVKEDADGSKNSGQWIYEVLFEENRYQIQNKQSLIRELGNKMIDMKMKKGVIAPR